MTKKRPGSDGAALHVHNYPFDYTDDDDEAHYDAVMEGMEEDGPVLTKENREAIINVLADVPNLARLHRLAVRVSAAKELMDAGKDEFNKAAAFVTIRGRELEFLNCAMALALNSATRRARRLEQEGG